MYSSVMNAVIELSLGQQMKLPQGQVVRDFLKGSYRRGGTGVRLSRGKFLPGHQALGGNFCQALGFGGLFTSNT